MVGYPSDWKVKTVDQLANISTGCRDVKDSVKTGKYPLFVRSKQVESIDSFDYDCEAVLTAGDGGTGKVFHYYNGKFSAHQRVYVLNNFKGIRGKYFYYVFSQNFINQVQKFTAKSTVDSVRKPMIAEMEIPLPPLKEQQAIVEVLESFDKHIKNLEALIAKKRDIRDGALQDLMSGRVRVDGFSGEWKPGNLLDFVELVQGLTYKPEDVRTSGTLVLRSSNIQNGVLSLEDNVYVNCEINERIKAQPGDILVCVRNGSSSLIGKSCILPKLDNTTFGAFMTVLRGDETGFFAKLFESEPIQNQINNRSNATINQITKQDFESLKVYVPEEREEQQAIAEILTSMDDEIDCLEAEKEKWEQIRDGAMDDLLSGKVRVSK